MNISFILKTVTKSLTSWIKTQPQQKILYSEMEINKWFKEKNINYTLTIECEPTGRKLIHLQYNGD